MGGFASPDYDGSIKESASVWVREAIALNLGFPKIFWVFSLLSTPRCHGIKAKVLAQIRTKSKKKQECRRYKANASQGWRPRINHNISVHAEFLFLRAERHSRRLTAAAMEPLAVQQPQRLPWMSLSSQVTFLVKEWESTLAFSSLALSDAVWAVVATNTSVAALSYSAGPPNPQEPYLNNLLWRQ